VNFLARLLGFRRVEIVLNVQPGAVVVTIAPEVHGDVCALQVKDAGNSGGEK